MQEQAYRHVSVIEGVAATLREWIFGGRLRPGAQLKEVQLAQTLGVGRYTLRSAIEILVRQDLLRRERNRGAFVRQITAEDIEDLYIIREAIEGQTAALLVERHLDLTPLRRALDALHDLTAESSWTEVNRRDFQFHRTMNEIVGSPRLRQAFDAIEPQLQLLLSTTQSDMPNYANVAAFHDRLFDALTSGIPERARSAIREHINISRREALSAIARENGTVTRSDDLRGIRSERAAPHPRRRSAPKSRK